MLAKIPHISRCDLAYEAIFEKIKGSEPGARLDSIKSLSGQLGVSVFTIQQALERLEKEGYVVKKHGAGTFVAARLPDTQINSAIPICIDPEGHIFGEMCGHLIQALHAQGQSAVPLGVADRDLLAQRLRSYAAAGTRHLLIHANLYFPYPLLQEKVFSDTNVICILDKRASAAKQDWHGVIWDPQAAAQLVCDHLWKCGHRHILLTGTSSMVPPAEEDLYDYEPYGCSFLDAWKSRGGTYTPVVYVMRGDGLTWSSHQPVMDILHASDAPTAVVSLFDLAAFSLQKLLLETDPELATRLEIIGNGNTPWSQAGHPPISSVDWNLPAIVDETAKLIAGLEEGTIKEPQLITVTPRLVLRGHSGNSPASI